MICAAVVFVALVWLARWLIVRASDRSIGRTFGE